MTMRDHQRAPGANARQRLEALALRPVEQVVAVDVQHVEEDRRQRQLRAQRSRRRAGGRSGAWCPGRRAVCRRAEARAPRRRGSATRAGSARTASTTSGTAAVTGRSAPREDHDVVAGLVHLDARAVELVLERRVAQRPTAPRPRRRRHRPASAARAGGREDRRRRGPRRRRAHGARPPAPDRRPASRRGAPARPARRRRARRPRRARPRARPGAARRRAGARGSPARVRGAAQQVAQPLGAPACAASARSATPARQTRRRPRPASAMAAPAGGTSRASRIAAPPMPSRPCGVTPDKYAIATGTSSGATCVRSAARWPILPSRLGVSATAREASTRTERGVGMHAVAHSVMFRRTVTDRTP